MTWRARTHTHGTATGELLSAYATRGDGNGRDGNGTLCRLKEVQREKEIEKKNMKDINFGKIWLFFGPNATPKEYARQPEW